MTGPMEMSPICQLLPWDTDFFGCKIGRVNADRLDEEALSSIMSWCDLHRIACLYFLADANDSLTSELAQSNGFRLVDIRMTFDQLISDPQTQHGGPLERAFRTATLQDVSALKAIAQVSHRDTRFHFDSHFPAARSDALYQTWIENSCNGYADAVLLAEFDGNPSGYVSCHLSEQKIGRIGIIAVAQDKRGIGLGQALVNNAIQWFGQHDIQRVEVITQGRNCAAQRLYQRCGFLTRSVQLWYHRWFAQKDALLDEC